ncbi:hypothetical protein TRFO_38345 [Tritrichomonas foetus]|uniref:Condensation domain-containing protein n=1 Tax=Tritrichomonas foetus TaxID=1144522 RepID=A0A1J4J8L2_9EUKA|nr:hypothetical protein TRFO_38345 [Tritrichomonas foetus]|eukprot:OHS95530.1 hypothetical protein TRFO_38345 [Tritrichomonas foetus]
MIRPKLKHLEPLDYIFQSIKCFLQIGIEFETPKDTEIATNELLKIFNGFHIACGDYFLYSKKNDVVIHKIPENLKTLQDASDWIYDYHTQDLREILASIAVDDNRILLNTSHICCDGNFAIRLIEHLCNPTETLKMSYLPQNATNFFWKEISKIPSFNSFNNDNNFVTTILSKKSPSNLEVSAFKKRIPHDFIILPVDSLKGYDYTIKRPKNLSESIWTSLTLSNSAFEQKLDKDHFGVSTVFDLRRILNESQRNDFSLQNFITSIPVNCSPEYEMTVDTVGKLMRQNFQMRLKRKDYLANLKAIYDAFYQNENFEKDQELEKNDELNHQSMLEMSNLGEIKIQSPIKDAFISLLCPPDFDFDTVSFLCFTINNLTKNEKKFVGEFQFSPQRLRLEEAKMFKKSIQFGLTHLSNQLTVHEAINKLQEIQSK